MEGVGVEGLFDRAANIRIHAYMYSGLFDRAVTLTRMYLYYKKMQIRILLMRIYVQLYLVSAS